MTLKSDKILNQCHFTNIAVLRTPGITMKTKPLYSLARLEVEKHHQLIQ